MGGAVGTVNRQAELVIEPATPEDVDDLLRIEEASFTSPWTRKMFEVELIRNPFGRLYTARLHRSAILGYLCVWIVFEELRIMNLAVSPQARRQGIGMELTCHGLKVGLDHDARRAVLEVRASNTDAIRLYGRVGFLRHAVRKEYYNSPVEDAVLMELDPITLPI
jgi:ribosomal-protein-alanine N-acetyltransferase